MKHLLLIIILLAGTPVLAQAGWLKNCGQGFAGLFRAEAPQPSAAESRLAGLRAQYEKMLGDEHRSHELVETLTEIQQLQNQQAAKGLALPTISPQKKYIGEQWGRLEQMRGKRVRYFTPRERAALEITVDKAGLIRRADGSLANNCQKLATLICDPGLFVMDANGRFYFYAGPMRRKQEGAIHHSSFFGGLPVAGAGEFEILDGKIMRMSGSSGHYRPGKPFLTRVIEELKHQRVKSLPDRIGLEGLWGVIGK